MPAGIEIYNDNNVIQITEKYRNMQFIQKYNHTLPLYEYGLMSAVSVNPAPTNGLWAAFRTDYTSSTKYCLNSVIVSLSSSKLLSITGADGVAIDTYVFGLPVTAGNHFEVYNSQNQLVFSDAIKPMKVLATFNGTYTQADFDAVYHSTGGNITNIANQVPTVKGSYTIPSGKTVAVIARGGYYMHREPDNVGQMTHDVSNVFQFSATTISWGLKVTNWNEYQGLGTGTNIVSDFRILIVDVTGL